MSTATYHSEFGTLVIVVDDDHWSDDGLPVVPPGMEYAWLDGEPITEERAKEILAAIKVRRQVRPVRPPWGVASTADMLESLLVEADQRIAAPWARSPEDRTTLCVQLRQLMTKAYQRGYDDGARAER